VSLPLRVRRRAELDMNEAYAWYEVRLAGLGDAFLDAVEACFNRIEQHPEGAPQVEGRCSPRSTSALSPSTSTRARRLRRRARGLPLPSSPEEVRILTGWDCGFPCSGESVPGFPTLISLLL
jgi:hypothetical protein